MRRVSCKVVPVMLLATAETQTKGDLEMIEYYITPVCSNRAEPRLASVLPLSHRARALHARLERGSARSEKIAGPSAHRRS